MISSLARFFFFCLFLVFGCVGLHGQTFINEYDNGVDDRGWQSVELPSGGILTCGSTEESDNRWPTVVYSTSSTGTVNWQDSYGDDGYRWTHGSILLSIDNNVILAGSRSEFGVDSTSISLFKITPTGEELWSKSYALNWKSSITGIVELDNGDLIGIGSTYPIPSWSFQEVLLVRFDSNGDTLWTKSYPTPGIDGAADIILNSEGELIGTGFQTDSNNENSVAWLSKYDLTGNIIWTSTYETDLETTSSKVVETSDGGYVLVGMDHDLPAIRRNILVVRTDEEGVQLWLNTYGGEDDDKATDVILDDDDNLFVIGYAEDPVFHESDGLLMHLSASGDSLWSHTYGYDDDDEFNAGLKTSDGRFLMTGTTEGNSGIQDDIFLVMSDMEGNISGIDDWNSTLDLMLYPNPCHESFRLIGTANRSFARVRIEIMDLSGKTINTRNLQTANLTSEVFRASGLASGTYIVSLNYIGSNSLGKVTRLVVY